MYEYRARCVNVVDGDTLDLVVDVGLYLTARARCRISGINTPELHAKDDAERDRAARAKAFVIDALSMTAEQRADSWPLKIRTYKSDSFGRWLADVEFQRDGRALDLATELLMAKLAEPYRR
jgi:micrococcal nuclease